MISCCRHPFIFFLLLIVQLAAQSGNATATADTTAFRIQDYIPGEYFTKLRSVNLSTSGYGRTSPDRYTDTPTPVLFDLGRADQGGNASSTYYDYRYYESRSMIRRQIFRGSLYQNGYKIDDPYVDTFVPDTLNFRISGDDRITRSSTATIDWDFDQKLYNPNNWFVQIKPSVKGTYYKYTNEFTTKDRARLTYRGEFIDSLRFMDATGGYESTYLRRVGTVRLGLGHGRLYNGRETWKAMLLADEIARIMDSPHEGYNKQAVMILADTLYKLSVKSYAAKDGPRLRQLDKDEQIFLFFMDQLGDITLSPRTAAMINDIIRYESNTPTSRLFGRSISLFFEANIDELTDTEKRNQMTLYSYYDFGASVPYREDEYSSERDITQDWKEISYSIGLEYIHAKPMGTRWQIDRYGSIFINRTVWSEEITDHLATGTPQVDPPNEPEEYYYIAEADFSVNLWYFHNSRNIFKMTPSLKYTGPWFETDPPTNNQSIYDNLNLWEKGTVRWDLDLSYKRYLTRSLYIEGWANLRITKPSKKDIIINGPRMGRYYGPSGVIGYEDDGIISKDLNTNIRIGASLAYYF